MHLCLFLLALCQLGTVHGRRIRSRLAIATENHSVVQERRAIRASENHSVVQERGPIRVRHWLEPGPDGKYIVVEELVESLVDWAGRFNANPKKVLQELRMHGVKFLDMKSALTNVDGFVREARKIKDAAIWFNLPEGQPEGPSPFLSDVEIEDPSSPGLGGADLRILTEGANEILRLFRKSGHLVWDQEDYGNMARISSKQRQEDWHANGTFFGHLDEYRHMRLAWVVQGEPTIFMRSRKGPRDFSEVHRLCRAKHPRNNVPRGLIQMHGCDSPQMYRDFEKHGWEVVQPDPDPRVAALWWLGDWLTTVPHRSPFNVGEKTNERGNGRIFSAYDFAVDEAYVPAAYVPADGA